MNFEIDYTVALFIHNVFYSSQNFFTPIFKAITSFGNHGLGFILIAVILLLFKRTRKLSIYLLVTLLFTYITYKLLKVLIARPRPYTNIDSDYYIWWTQTGSIVESDLSFPSGHSAISACFATILFIKLNKKYSFLFFLIPLVIGFTRLYFNVHYFTDVLAGLFLGLICAILISLILDKILKKRL